MTAAPATTEQALHAAIAAGDHTAYAPLEDLYLEAGDEGAARAVAYLAGIGKWPLACKMADTPVKPQPVVWIFGKDSMNVLDGKWNRSLIGNLVHRSIHCQIIDATRPNAVVDVWNKLARGEFDPFHFASDWLYFRDTRQALDHLGRALEKL